MNPSPRIAAAIDFVTEYRKMGTNKAHFRARANEFPHPLAMELTGIASNPATREAFIERLNDSWASVDTVFPPLPNRALYGEVVIGSGFHAAVYCAARVFSGFEAPLVLERGNVGGAFAMTSQPVFWLNSRNRPGEPGFPRTGRALNYLPGAPIQASNLGVSEFQSNADMAFVIQVALAQYAPKVVRGAEVESVRKLINEYEIKLRGVERKLYAKRVIDARGLGVASGLALCNDTNILTYEQFMRRMAKPFPLKGVRRAAVIGAGDSARCAVESLLGLAPPPKLAVGALDTVDSVDWYAPDLPDRCDDWRRSQRGRYLAIGNFIFGSNNVAGKLRVKQVRGNVAAAMGMAIVNQQPYDLAVVATGYTQEPYLLAEPPSETISVGGFKVAKGKGGFYEIGPAANIGFSQLESEAGIDVIPANRVAMFRLATRTALLGCNLPT